MSFGIQKPCTAFEGMRRIAAGPLYEVALAVSSATDRQITIYDDVTGRVIDLDTRGTAEDVVARLAERMADEPARVNPIFEESPAGPRGPGRPKLGVVAREVTLLPRHWEWLASQPGGASVALRKLVEAARKSSGDQDRRRMAQEAAYRFMSATAGNLAGFEEALRALYAYDRRKFSAQIAAWPADVRDYAVKLAFADLEGA